MRIVSNNQEIITFIFVLEKNSWMKLTMMVLEWINSLTYSFIPPIMNAFSGQKPTNMISIPIITAIIGWLINWLTIKITFYPIKFIGIRPFFGWQGIIPAKAEKISGMMADNIISKLGSLKAFFLPIEIDQISNQVNIFFQDNIEHYINKIMLENNAIFWENLPRSAKEKIYGHIQHVLPELSRNMIIDIAQRIEDLIDLKEVITNQILKEKKNLNKIFMEVGHKELRFFALSGLYFGFSLGLIEMIIWIYFPEHWILLACGFIIGILTPFLAINCIFRPLHPIKLSRYHYQGLLLKRQKEASLVFCRLIAQDILSIDKIMQAILAGSHSHTAKRIITQHLKPLIEGPIIKIASQVALGENGYADLKKSIELEFIHLISESFKSKKFNIAHTCALEAMLNKRIQKLSPEEFQDVLRPVFQENQWVLVIISATLGMLAGLIQNLFIS